jgi:hypothetical protein
MNYILSLLICFTFLNAKPFANNFIEFNIPDSWNCASMGEVWSCTPMNPDEKKEAVLVMSFGTQGKEDSFEQYKKYFNEKITKRGSSKISKPKYVKYKEILGQTWVDSQHEGSEVKNFYTRYLATMKSGRVILLTATIKKDKYNYYMNKLYKTIESIKLRSTFPAQAESTGLLGLLGKKIDDLTKKKKATRDSKAITIEDAESGSERYILALIIAFIAFVAIFIYLKRRKKKKGIDKNKTNKKKGWLKK